MGSVQVSDDRRKIIDGAVLSELRSTIKSSTVLSPDSEGYAQSLKRWSESVEKEAVSVLYLSLASYLNSHNFTALLLKKVTVRKCLSLSSISYIL